MKTIFLRLSFVIFGILFILAMAGIVKGDVDGYSLMFQKDANAKVGGPFESTNSTSRFMLTEAIVKHRSLTLTKDEARSSAPDVVYYQGKFFSIFTPGVSFLSVPFYLLGELVGAPQIIGFLSVTLFAILNVFLICLLSKRLGTPTYAALTSGAIFLFATNGLSYSLTMTQHHMSVSIILLSLLLATSKKSFLNALSLGILYGLGILIDIPNAFFLLPVFILYICQAFTFERLASRIKIAMNPVILAALIGLIPLLGLFAWYNVETSGSPTLIAQSIGQTTYFDSAQERITKHDDERLKPVAASEAVPFKTRNELRSLYVLFISNERSWVYYSPVVFIGVIGVYLAYRQKERRNIALFVISVIAMNITVYALFGDPWGGWSFGPRYLIPAAALLSSGIGFALWKLKKNIIFMLGFVALLLYSTAINVLGALTTNAIPPKVEALSLANPLPYTYAYNFKLMDLNQLSSLAYNAAFSGVLDGQTFYIIVLATVYIILAIPLINMYISQKSK